MSGASLRDNSSVPQKSSQVQLGFVCNANECSGCKACVIACKDIYNLAPGKKFRRVLSGESGAWLEKDSIVSPVGVLAIASQFLVITVRILCVFRLARERQLLKAMKQALCK